MSFHAIVRMVVLPAAVAVGVAVLLRPLGPAAFVLAIAAFFAAQLAVLGRSQQRVESTRHRIAAIRGPRRQMRLQRRV